MRHSFKHDPTQVFTFCNTKHRFDQYSFVWDTRSTGIPISITDWCKENCLCDWGWWFNAEGHGVMGFMDRDEMINTMLLHSDSID